MARRRVILADELPEAAVARLRGAGVRLFHVQLWLDTHKTDGCTIAPDLYLAACAVHDYLCRTGVVRRWQADDIARDIIIALALNSEDELPWRLVGCGWAWVFWAGVVLGDLTGIGKKDPT